MRRVLHVIETMAPHEGGPPRVVAGLTVAQRAMGIDAHILSGDGPRLPEWLAYWRTHEPGFPAQCAHTYEGGSNRLARVSALRGWLRSDLAGFDIAHIHQLWRLTPTLAGQAASRLRVPYLIAPHTSLSPWALAQKPLKKALARRLAWNRIFARAAGFHALNELEAAEIRQSVGTGSPTTFVVPNGVSLAEFSAPEPREAVADLQPRRFILFLARLHTMKGPDLLLDAFASLSSAHPGLQLVFAGPDYGMQDTLLRRTQQLQLTGKVRFLGLVSGERRLWLLRNALCLGQPSRDEGFSLSILEAMASECPVVISERCKFPDVARQGAGIIVPLSVASLAAALQSYADDPSRRARDAGAARRLIETDYTWDKVAHTAERMYAQVATDRAS